MSPDLITDINQSLEISLPESISGEDLREKLVFSLYRIDVNESKMRHLLEQKEGKNAAGLIADLIIERQSEKIKSRQHFRQRDNDIDDNEKW